MNELAMMSDVTIAMHAVPGRRSAKEQFDEMIASGWKPSGGAVVNVTLGEADVLERSEFDQIVLAVARFSLPAYEPGKLVIPLNRVPSDHARFVEQAKEYLAKKGWRLVDAAA